MTVNRKIDSFVRPLIDRQAHRAVRSNGALAGKIIAAKLYRDNLLTNPTSITKETISKETNRRLKLIKNEEVKAGFSDGLKLIINGLNLSYSQKVDKVNELNALITMDLKVEDLINPPESPRVPQLPESFESPRVPLAPQPPKSFKFPRVSLPPQLAESIPLSELPPATPSAKVSRPSVASGTSSGKEKKVSFDDNATTVFRYPAELDTEAGLDVAGAHEKEGYTPDLDEQPSSSRQFKFPKVKYTPEDEVLPSLPDVDYTPESEAPPSLPDVDYAPEDESSAHAPSTARASRYDGGAYSLLTAPGDEYKAQGRFITTSAQDPYLQCRSFSLSVSLSSQEIDALPTVAGLRALIADKENDPRSLARLLVLSSKNKSGERWIYIGGEGDKYEFRKVVFNTEILVNK